MRVTYLFFSFLFYSQPNTTETTETTETTVADMSTSNGKDIAQDTTDELPNVSASEAPTEDNEDGEQKTMSTTKDRAHNNLDLECCICLENLPKDPTKFARLTCCGQGMHYHCSADLSSMGKVNDNCPLCRAKTPTSDEEHVKYLRPWVKKKKTWAQYLMGQMYRDGRGVKQSYEMTRMLYELAVQQGDALAMYDLGFIYEKGEGVEQSYEKAFEYYEQAAHLGLAKAQFNLGVMHKFGRGVEQSYEKAKEYYEQAAHLGDANAQYTLGNMYYHGRGVEQSYEKAKEYYEQAAHLGYANAQYNLGHMYATGEGVVKNEAEAHALWTLAAAQGDEYAINSLPILEKNMTKS